MAILYANNAATTLAGTLATGAVTLTVANGSFIQAVTAPDVMYLTLQDAVNTEIVKVTAHTATAASMTIVRAQDGTVDPGSTWAIGTTCECRITAGELTAFEALTVLPAIIAASSSKTTPVDADMIPIYDSVATTTKTKLSWANVKATLKTYFDTLYAAVAGSVSQAFAAASIELGHATDTTLTRVSAGVAAVEGATIGTLSTLQTWTKSQRGTVTTSNTITAIDLSTTNNHISTPGAGAALTFTNMTAGQCGTIEFVNGSNYAITAGSGTKVTSTFLATISATGTYIISYYVNAAGTAVHCSTGGASA